HDARQPSAGEGAQVGDVEAARDPALVRQPRPQGLGQSPQIDGDLATQDPEKLVHEPARASAAACEAAAPTASTSTPGPVRVAKGTESRTACNDPPREERFTDRARRRPDRRPPRPPPDDGAR